MNTYFIIILLMGLLYLFANLWQLVLINKSEFIEKHKDKIYIVFCASIIFCEGHHIANFLLNNFSYTAVFENSSINTPLIYKIAATYTGQGGSFLLWLFILTIIGIPFLKGKDSLVKALFMLFPLILTAAMYENGPFAKTLDTAHWNLTQPPLNGLGLKQILQNPYNLFHPPFLFVGFAFFYVPCILAFTILIQWNKLITDNNEKIINKIKIISKYNLLGIITLSIGILLGMLWAKSAWGRFWAWDPIENAALIPLLIALALLNATCIYKRKNATAMLKTSIILAAIIFPFILLCTFIVRSGIIRQISIHSYIDSNTMASLLILALILIIFLYAILLYLYRLRTILRTHKQISIITIFSRELFVSLSIIIFLLLALVVIVGTGSQILGNQYINADFYIKWCSPLLIILSAFYIIAILLPIFKKN